MGRCAWVSYVIMIMLILPMIASAATIKGSIYGEDLELLQGAIITINTTPEQKLIVKENMYLLQVPQGQYELTARYYVKGFVKLSSTEIIRVKDEGTYNLDIILFPANYDDGFSQIEFYEDYDVLDISSLDESFNVLYFIFPLIILIFAAIFFFLRKRNQPKEDEYEAKIMQMLRTHKRITQKEIRKELPIGEAKVSLIISDLESKGKIKKIRKGRGNIIVLNN